MFASAHKEQRQQALYTTSHFPPISEVCFCETNQMVEHCASSTRTICLYQPASYNGGKSQIKEPQRSSLTRFLCGAPV